MTAQEPQETTQPEKTARTMSRDLIVAQTPADVVEMRKQETRRRVTYGLVGTFCVVVLYCTVWVPAMRSEALTAVTAGAAAAYGFYFAGRMHAGD